MVAGEEHLAGQDALDVGPVQHHGRRPHPLHANAQDTPHPAARPEVHRQQRGLLDQDF